MILEYWDILGQKTMYEKLMKLKYFYEFYHFFLCDFFLCPKKKVQSWSYVSYVTADATSAKTTNLPICPETTKERKKRRTKKAPRMAISTLFALHAVLTVFTVHPETMWRKKEKRKQRLLQNFLRYIQLQKRKKKIEDYLTEKYSAVFL